jgi:release factor glutamine methyltransferase
MSPHQATWTILDLIRWTTGYFEKNGVSEPRASAEILLAHVLGLSRLDLYLKHDQPLTPEELSRFKSLIVRRRLGEPVAYLTGHKEFWSLDFLVAPGVLIPRPETEVLVEAAVDAARRGLPSGLPPRGLEVGVGSGAVVVALAKELPEFTWVGVDISRTALEVARENARRHSVSERIHLMGGDLLAAVRPGAGFALAAANLPYVTTAEWENLPKEIKEYEPPEALLGGEDGLALIRPLIAQAPGCLAAGGWLALEVGAAQADQVLQLLRENGAFTEMEALKDYQGIRRVIRARRL